MLNIIMELGSTQAIKEAVEAGLEIAIISRLAIKTAPKIKATGTRKETRPSLTKMAISVLALPPA